MFAKDESAGSQMALWCSVEEDKVYMKTDNMLVKPNDHPLVAGCVKRNMILVLSSYLKEFLY